MSSILTGLSAPPYSKGGILVETTKGWQIPVPVNKRHDRNAGYTVAQRRRRWATV